MSERKCQGCGDLLPPNRGPGPKRKWCSDRCRKQTLYSGTCVDCGERTNGVASGVDRAPKRCSSCNGRHTYTLTHQWIIGSFAEWVETFGAPPSASDWNPAYTRRHPYLRWKYDRTLATGRKWPAPAVVLNHFGSWNNALRELGYRVLAPSEYWIGHEGIALRDADGVAA